MTDRELTRLLFGPYRTPRLRRGDRAFCLYRDYAVVVVRISDTRIPWPRCRPLDPPRKGLGLLVDDELARAVRHESATAVAYWWGVNRSTVHKWRRALGVTRTNNPGTHRLVLGAIEDTMAVRFTPVGRGTSRRFTTCLGRAAVWTPDEVALLGAVPDAEVARRTGRTAAAVGKKRLALGRPPIHEHQSRRAPRRPAEGRTP
jgi:hypothetical protein